MKLDKVIESRKSVRKYNSKTPSWKKIIEAIDAARHSPSAGGIHSLKFIIVDDSEKIQKLTKACDQNFINSAQYVVVACSTTSLMENSYGNRGERYLRQQAGAGIQNFLLKLTEFKLATCWVGHFLDTQIKKILGIPKDVNVEALFPIGFEGEKKKPSKKVSCFASNTAGHYPILYCRIVTNIRFNSCSTTGPSYSPAWADEPL